MKIVFLVFFVGLIGLVILLDDLGDGDDGRDLHPLVALGVGTGLGGVVGVGPPLQNDVGRAEIAMDWSQDKKICYIEILDKALSYMYNKCSWRLGKTR